MRWNVTWLKLLSGAGAAMGRSIVPSSGGIPSAAPPAQARPAFWGQLPAGFLPLSTQPLCQQQQQQGSLPGSSSAAAAASAALLSMLPGGPGRPAFDLQGLAGEAASATSATCMQLPAVRGRHVVVCGSAQTLPSAWNGLCSALCWACLA